MRNLATKQRFQSCLNWDYGISTSSKEMKIKPEKLDLTCFSTECNIQIKGSRKVVYLSNVIAGVESVSVLISWVL